MFREGKCPRCKEVIQVPDGREKILCMYCGSEISVSEALGEKREYEPAVCERNFEKASRELAGFADECEDPMKAFTKDAYAGAFEAFCGGHLELFQALELVYQNAEDPKEKLEKLAERLAVSCGENVKSLKSRSSRNQRQLDLNLLVCVYLIPAVRRYSAEFSEPFADCVVEAWNRTFGTTIRKASQEEIEQGFRRKLCYITTAVCQSLGKGPECRELQILKDYRDQYMEQTEEGRAMVEEYYDVAPTLVKRINREENREEIYRMLYQEYIKPCLEEIETGEYETCGQRYQEMVKSLRARYMN